MDVAFFLSFSCFSCELSKSVTGSVDCEEKAYNSEWLRLGRKVKEELEVDCCDVGGVSLLVPFSDVFVRDVFVGVVAFFLKRSRSACRPPARRCKCMQ